MLHRDLRKTTTFISPQLHKVQSITAVVCFDAEAYGEAKIMIPLEEIGCKITKKNIARGTQWIK